MGDWLFPRSERGLAPAALVIDRCIAMSPFGLKAHEIPSLPKCAWLAVVPPDAEAVHVYHGPGVETRSDWIFEGCWAGAFEEGGFDKTDIVCGTGIRLREGRACFVSSGSTSDRLQYFTSQAGVHVSNSLVFLLTATENDLDPQYTGYWDDMEDLCSGLSKYRQTLHTVRGDVGLCYFHNLLVEAGRAPSWAGAQARPRLAFASSGVRLRPDGPAAEGPRGIGRLEGARDHPQVLSASRSGCA